MWHLRSWRISSGRKNARPIYRPLRISHGALKRFAKLVVCDCVNIRTSCADVLKELEGQMAALVVLDKDVVAREESPLAVVQQQQQQQEQEVSGYRRVCMRHLPVCYGVTLQHQWHVVHGGTVPPLTTCHRCWAMTSSPTVESCYYTFVVCFCLKMCTVGFLFYLSCSYVVF